MKRNKGKDILFFKIDNIENDLTLKKNTKSNLIMNRSLDYKKIALLELQIAIAEINRGYNRKSLSNIESAIGFLRKMSSPNKWKVFWDNVRKKSVSKRKGKSKSKFLPTFFGFLVYKWGIDPITANYLATRLMNTGDMECTIENHKNFLEELKLWVIDSDETDSLWGTYDFKDEDFEKLKKLKQSFQDKIEELEKSE